MKKNDLYLHTIMEKEIESRNKKEVLFINNDKFKINPDPVKKYKHNDDLTLEDKNLERIKKYDPLLLKAYELLLPQYKLTLISVLESFEIPENVRIMRLLGSENPEETENKFIIIVSKGQLYLQQGNWLQMTESKSVSLVSDKKIFKDKDAIKHIKLCLDIEIPSNILKQVTLNSKKQIPIIENLTGFEPYNLMDMSDAEYKKQRREADVKAMIYADRYKDHIKLLSNISPYQAGNSFLLLQADLNLMIQKCIHNLLCKGYNVTTDLIINCSFETLAEATKNLFIKYHAIDTTEIERVKIRRFIALYFAVVEETQNKFENYIESLYEKYNLEEQFVNI